MRREITSIRSFNQALFTRSNMKDGLGSYYDKFNMLNKIDCVPFGFIGSSTESNIDAVEVSLTFNQVSIYICIYK